MTYTLLLLHSQLVHDVQSWQRNNALDEKSLLDFLVVGCSGGAFAVVIGRTAPLRVEIVIRFPVPCSVVPFPSHGILLRRGALAALPSCFMRAFSSLIPRTCFILPASSSPLTRFHGARVPSHRTCWDVPLAQHCMLKCAVAAAIHTGKAKRVRPRFAHCDAATHFILAP